MTVKTGVSFAYKDDRPDGAKKVAKQRMAGFVKEFGRTILLGDPMSLHAFAESCYLQGAEDMALVAIRDNPSEVIDFQI